MAFNWSISDQEKENFTHTFKSLNPVHGKVDSKNGRDYLVKSSLPTTTLAKIWNLADSDKDGQLTLNEFIIANKLITLCLKGFSVPSNIPQELLTSLTAEKIRSTIVQTPSIKYDNLSELFSSIDTSIQLNSTKPVISIPNPSPVFNSPHIPQKFMSTANDTRSINNDRYIRMFNNTTSVAVDNKVSAEEVKDLFLQSGLSKDVLAKIWDESDRDMDGKLSQSEFIIAIAMIEYFLDGRPFNPTFKPSYTPISIQSQNFDVGKQNLGYNHISQFVAQSPYPTVDIFGKGTENASSKNWNQADLPATAYNPVVTNYLDNVNKKLTTDLYSANLNLNALKASEQSTKEKISNLQFKMSETKERNELIKVAIETKEKSLVQLEDKIKENKLKNEITKPMNKESTSLFNTSSNGDPFTQNIIKSASNVDLFYNPLYSPKDPFKFQPKQTVSTVSDNVDLFALAKQPTPSNVNFNDRNLFTKDNSSLWGSKPLNTTTNVSVQSTSKQTANYRAPPLPSAVSHPILNQSPKKQPSLSIPIENEKSDENKPKSIFNKMFHKGKSKDKKEKPKKKSKNLPISSTINKPVIPPKPTVNNIPKSNTVKLPQGGFKPPIPPAPAINKQIKTVPQNVFALPEYDPDEHEKRVTYARYQNKEHASTSLFSTTTSNRSPSTIISMDEINRIAKDLEISRVDTLLGNDKKLQLTTDQQKEIKLSTLNTNVMHSTINPVSNWKSIESVTEQTWPSSSKFINKEDDIKSLTSSSSEDADMITHTIPLEVIAINNYDSNEVEFSFKIGDKLSVMFENDEYYYTEINEIGDWFPKFYTKKYVPPGFLEKYDVKGYLKALYENVKEHDDDLPFSENDIIIQIKEFDEWITGYSSGQEGIFPKIYVESLYSITVKEIKTVTKSFEAKHQCELTIQEGFNVAILHVNASGWCLGIIENQHKLGYFPPGCI